MKSLSRDEDDKLGDDYKGLEAFAQMWIICLAFIALWIFIGLALALYVRACVEDENLKNQHAV